ncbi:MAG: hypothetical protein AAGF12_17460 [Myxococcota bacterium]
MMPTNAIFRFLSGLACLLAIGLALTHAGSPAVAEGENSEAPAPEAVPAGALQVGQGPLDRAELEGFEVKLVHTDAPFAMVLEVRNLKTEAAEFATAVECWETRGSMISRMPSFPHRLGEERISGRVAAGETVRFSLPFASDVVPEGLNFSTIQLRLFDADVSPAPTEAQAPAHVGFSLPTDPRPLYAMLRLERATSFIPVPDGNR